MRRSDNLAGSEPTTVYGMLHWKSVMIFGTLPCGSLLAYPNL